ncbi:MAG: sugar transferase [Actinobacteria bacterium]|nr:sugar transferase [Actinomycetota bacterium]
MDGLPLLRLTRPTLSGISRLLKGLVDRTGAAVLLLLLAPLLLGLALALRSGGDPTLVRQTHVGHGGTPFTLPRFCSAVTVPDQHATAMDAWIHRNGLDRLPQLFNVLGGSMSLVGPRPARPDEVAAYPSGILAANVVHPGLTGLWQNNGSTNLSPEESLRLNMRYVQHWSLA